jgi:hypothetical protein
MLTDKALIGRHRGINAEHAGLGASAAPTHDANLNWATGRAESKKWTPAVALAGVSATCLEAGADMRWIDTATIGLAAALGAHERHVDLKQGRGGFLRPSRANLLSQTLNHLGLRQPKPCHGNDLTWAYQGIHAAACCQRLRFRSSSVRQPQQGHIMTQTLRTVSVIWVSDDFPHLDAAPTTSQVVGSFNNTD